MTVKEYCSKKRSETTIQLIEILKHFSDEDDYILGILAESNLDSDRQRIIDYIEKSNEADYENVILFALEIGNKRRSRSKKAIEVERES